MKPEQIAFAWQDDPLPEALDDRGSLVVPVVNWINWINWSRRGDEINEIGGGGLKLVFWGLGLGLDRGGRHGRVRCTQMQVEVKANQLQRPQARLLIGYCMNTRMLSA